MSAPVRIQLSRRKGFDLQKVGALINGLPTVNCGRPGIWGNPFVIGKPSGYGFADDGDPAPMMPALTRGESISMFESLAIGILHPEMHPHGHQWVDRLRKRLGSLPVQEQIRIHLRGKNLACFCAPDEACHCDVLLELANE